MWSQVAIALLQSRRISLFICFITLVCYGMKIDQRLQASVHEHGGIGLCERILVFEWSEVIDNSPRVPFGL